MPLGRSWGRPLGRRTRRIIAAVVVVLVVVAATGTWLLTRPGDAAAAQTITATVSSGTYQQTVSATGTLAPQREGDLSFGVSGRVTKVFVGAGDAVHKGDVLATLDDTSLRAALDSASAQLDASQAQYTDDADADASSTQLAADSASVASAKSGLSQAQDDLDSATLRSTMTGTVASVDVAVGDQVSGTSSSSSSAGSNPSSGGNNSANANGASDSSASSASSSSSSGSSTSAFVVVSPHKFEVVADVAADDVASVRKGMQAQITPTGATQPVYGTVTAVGLVAEASSSGAATFPVTVTLTGPQAKLYAGTSATVSIITRQVSNVIAVPTLALHTSGSTTYVEKQTGGKRVRTTVKVGQTYGANTQITSGLKSGDVVVITSVRLPTGSRTGTNGNRFGGGGGFGGGGFGGGTGPPGGFGNGGGAP